MNKSEFLSSVMNCEINKKRSEEIRKIYGAELDHVVEKIISYADTVDFFDDERRALSYAEIHNPKKIMKFNFIEFGIIPLIDAYDNSYIVYIPSEKCWGKFNTIDKILFKKRSSINELL